MSTREQVLKNLLTRQRCTINELADAVCINPISVRHHITKLEADGLVTSEEERHGVGRPRRVYFLTEQGMEEFPSRYLRLTSGLLGMIKDNLPSEMVAKLFTDVAEEMVEQHIAQVDLSALEKEERLELLRQLLLAEGFTVEIERQDGTYFIHETTCPYYHVGQEHREVCIVDETLITNVLAAPAVKTKCMLDGDTHCSYEVNFIQASEIKELKELSEN